MTNKPAYIGPERRKGQRRSDGAANARIPSDRRVAPERRQDAMMGVCMNMTADDLTLLADIWKRVEASRRDYGREMTYDEIIAREA